MLASIQNSNQSKAAEKKIVSSGFDRSDFAYIGLVDSACPAWFLDAALHYITSNAAVGPEPWYSDQETRIANSPCVFLFPATWQTVPFSSTVDDYLRCSHVVTYAYSVAGQSLVRACEVGIRSTRGRLGTNVGRFPYETNSSSEVDEGRAN